MSNLQKFNSTLEDFDKEVGKLKAVSGAYQKLEGLIAAYDKISSQLDQHNKTIDKINVLQIAQQEKLTKSLGELSKLIDEKNDQIRKENKEFYKELENTIKLKLNDNKSEIKQLIENERNQIKQIFELEFAKNSKELRQVIEIETNKQTDLLQGGQKTIKQILWTLGSLLVILAAVTLYKLWM